MKKTYTLILSSLLISSVLAGCGSQTELSPDQSLLTAPVQNVETNARRKAQPGKIVRMIQPRNKIRKNSGSSYEATLRFEYNGSLFTPASQDVAEFMERFRGDVDDWELEELDNDSFDQLGKRRFRLTVFGPDRRRLDDILSKYRDHLRSNSMY